MQLSLSVRIAEAETKDRMTIPFEQFARLAHQTGYAAVCMRASAGGVQTPRSEPDFDVPRNNDHGPDNLRNIGPHLDVAECLGASLIRVCMKREEDIAAAARAADLARERGIRLAHQCHTNSLFETIEQIVEVLSRIGRENFGLIYEPANLMLCGQPYDGAALKRLAPWLMNVYVQNHRLAADGTVCLPTRVRGDVRYHDIPLWESGGVDFGAVFAGLKAIGYAGHVTVHQQFAKLMGPQEAASQSFAFLSQRS
jgi:sugar phosphate isomerase/epimerase